MKEEWMISLSFRVDSIFFSQISAQFAWIQAKESRRREREREKMCNARNAHTRVSCLNGSP